MRSKHSYCIFLQGLCAGFLFVGYAITPSLPCLGWFLVFILCHIQFVTANTNKAHTISQYPAIYKLNNFNWLILKDLVEGFQQNRWNWGSIGLQFSRLKSEMSERTTALSSRLLWWELFFHYKNPCSMLLSCYDSTKRILKIKKFAFEMRNEKVYVFQNMYNFRNETYTCEKWCVHLTSSGFIVLHLYLVWNCVSYSFFIMFELCSVWMLFVKQAVVFALSVNVIFSV